MKLPPVSAPDSPFGTEPAQNVETTTAEAAPGQQAPASSTARRGFLSSLFNNLGLNWTRR